METITKKIYTAKKNIYIYNFCFTKKKFDNKKYKYIGGPKNCYSYSFAILVIPSLPNISLGQIVSELKVGSPEHDSGAVAAAGGQHFS